jgi:hypothetical protein
MFKREASVKGSRTGDDGMVARLQYQWEAAAECEYTSPQLGNGYVIGTTAGDLTHIVVLLPRFDDPKEIAV